MIALAVWGLAIVRGLIRGWLRITYRSDGLTVWQEPDPQAIEFLKNRTDPWK